MRSYIDVTAFVIREYETCIEYELTAILKINDVYIYGLYVNILSNYTLLKSSRGVLNFAVCT